jgi:hypothetical protein
MRMKGCQLLLLLSNSNASGLNEKPMTIEDIANLVVVEAPKKRGTYKSRLANKEI